jgi:DNA processing protein
MTSTTRNTPPRAPTQDEAFARIRLLRSPHIGGVTYLQLLQRCGDAVSALATLPDLAARGKGDGGRGEGGDATARKRPYHPASEAAISAEIAAVKRAGARYIFHDSPDYPPLLRMADGAPPILIARGQASLARALPVAMVGARNASASAVRMAEGWARELAAAGCAVVSGLARGIDAAAHRGALAGGSGGGAGGTIAIIASGIDIAYPPQNAALHDQIAAEGLLLTEMPPGTQPVAHMFPARNRIIAGIACGTLVVEASVGSGSLITARLAGEAGREVMAVPGSPLDPRSRGCNALIRDGAVLVQGPEDVLELIRGFAALLDEDWDEAEADTPPPAPRAPRAAPAPTQPTDEALPSDLASLLSMAPIGIDELVRQSGAGAGAVQLALVELELAGRLARHPGGRVSLTA